MGAELKAAIKPKSRERAGEEKGKAEITSIGQTTARRSEGEGWKRKLEEIYRVLITGYYKNDERRKAESQWQMANKMTRSCSGEKHKQK